MLANAKAKPMSPKTKNGSAPPIAPGKTGEEALKAKKLPAKNGPAAFTALPPKEPNPFIVARWFGGTVLFVAIVMLEKKRSPRILYSAKSDPA